MNRSICSVYIACPWVKKDYAKAVRTQLNEANIAVTSRWIDFVGDSDDPAVLEQEAYNDIDDVLRADALLLLNLQKRGEETSGKAVETGIALAKGKPVLMVGAQSNVFHYLQSIRKFNTVEDAIKEIRYIEAPCRVCGGSGFIAMKRCIDDGYGEVDSCPDCVERLYNARKS